MPSLLHIEQLSPKETLYNLASDMGIIFLPSTHCTLDSVPSFCFLVYTQ